MASKAARIFFIQAIFYYRIRMQAFVWQEGLI
jgi:hypothetical protein